MSILHTKKRILFTLLICLASFVMLSSVLKAPVNSETCGSKILYAGFQEYQLSAYAEPSAVFPAPLTEWNKTYGGVKDDYVWHMIQTRDGGYALAGSTQIGVGYNRDGWLVKTDEYGNMTWSQTYDVSSSDEIYGLVQTSDGGYALVGQTIGRYWWSGIDFWLVKTDSAGTMMWNITYGLDRTDVALYVVQTNDEGYAVAGYGGGGIWTDAWLLKTDRSGNVDWLKTYGSRDYDDRWLSVNQTSDGGYVLAGYADAMSGFEGDLWLAKTNSRGDIVWDKKYGTPDGIDRGFSLVPTNDGGYAIAGVSSSYSIKWDAWLVKTDASGNMQWNQTYGGIENDYANSVIQVSDGGYMFSGRTESFATGIDDYDIWLVKTDGSGNMEWNQTYGGTGGEYTSEVIQTMEGGFAVAGSTQSFGVAVGLYNGWLIKLAPEDRIAPTTSHDYVDFWHTTDFNITLTPNDNPGGSGVANTYYKINNDETIYNVRTDGQPRITSEGADNKLEYWSVDNAGNVESPNTLTGIQLDKTDPFGSIFINNDDTYTIQTSVTLDLTATDIISDVYKVRFSNDGIWDDETWEDPSTTRENWELPLGDGTKWVYYQIKDNAGRLSPTYSDDIVLDTTPPKGSVTINGGDKYTTSTSVDLTLTADADVALMRFSNNTADWSDWEPYTLSRKVILKPDDGERTVYYQIKDKAGNPSQTYNDTIILDTTPPTGTITINNGATYTNSRSVNLILEATDETSNVKGMYFSHNNQYWSPRHAFTELFLWNLEPGDGEKTVYYKVEDNAGHISESYLATIILDTVQPTGSITINDGATYTTSPSVTLTLDATDTTSGFPEMRFSNNGTIWESWESFSQSRDWTLEPNDGERTVYYQVKDDAGNPSETYSATITLDTTPPSGTITIAEGSTYANTLSITLTLDATDETSDIAQMRFSNNGTTWTPWEAYDTSKTWSLPTGDGTKTVYVQFMDNAGKVSETTSDSIMLDTLPPSIELTVSLSNGTKITSSTYTISWNSTDAGSGIDHYEVRLDNDTWANRGTNTTYTFTGLTDGEHTFNIKAVDKTGKSQIYSVNVNISTPPTGVIGYTELAIIGGAVGAIAAGLVLYKITKRPKKPPTPTKLKIQAQPTEIVADGKSKSTITLQLLDKKGKPIPAQTDTEVKLTPTRGKIETPVVKIPKGEEAGKTVLISSTESGTINLSADAAGLKSIAITLEFKEKPRFCMGCGNRMSEKDKKCKKCRASPEQFTGPAKICKNCERMGQTTYIPLSAEFCNECGASQPKGEPSG